jgi:hypothetical protein
MRTTLGQDAFGHNVQAIITYLIIVKTFLTCTVGRVISVRVQHTYSRVHTPTNEFSVNYLYFRIIPAMLSRSAKQHPSNSAHFMSRFVRGLSICIYQLFIPSDFRA